MVEWIAEAPGGGTYPFAGVSSVTFINAGAMIAGVAQGLSQVPGLFSVKLVDVHGGTATPSKVAGDSVPIECRGWAEPGGSGGGA